jgi:FkbM family methyltransferase
VVAVYDRIVGHPWIAPLKPSWQRSRHTTSPLRFFVREALLRRRQTASYVMREGGAQVTLRHATPDVFTLDEVFIQHTMDVPAEVDAAVARLGRPPVVADLGANVGMASAWLSARWPGARLVCVEPDPLNLEVLREAARAGGWRVVEAAAAAAPGTLEFSAGEFAASHAVEGGGTIVEAIDFFALAEQERPDVVKIDVEGGEWALLGDPRLASLPAVALFLEYHPHLCPAADPQAEAHRLLEAAGFSVREVPATLGAPSGVGSLWAWRP